MLKTNRYTKRKFRILKDDAEGSMQRAKLLGLPRSLVGALIGILMFLLILLPLKFLDYNSLLLYMLALDLELPGRMIILILGMTAGIDLPKSFLNALSITISATPAGIAGVLISSPKKSARNAGIILSFMYLCFILAFGSLLSLLGI